MERDGHSRSQSVLSVFFKAGTPRATLVCSLHYDVETLMLLYGFIAGRGALSAARKDYFKALCWLWNVKCSNHPHSNFQGEFGGVLQKWASLKEDGKSYKGMLFCSVYHVKQIYIWLFDCVA